jgi:hypothetical protein
VTKTFDVSNASGTIAKRFRWWDDGMSKSARKFARDIDEDSTPTFSGEMGAEACEQYYRGRTRNAVKVAKYKASVKAGGRKVVLSLGPIDKRAAQALKDQPAGATATVEALGLSLAGVVS